MENAAFSEEIILTEVPLNSKLRSSKECIQFIPVKETEEQIVQIESIGAKVGDSKEYGSCACANDGENHKQKIQLVDWTPLKAKIFVIVLGCFVVWAAVFFTLNYYDFL